MYTILTLFWIKSAAIRKFHERIDYYIINPSQSRIIQDPAIQLSVYKNYQSLMTNLYQCSTASPFFIP